MEWFTAMKDGKLDLVCMHVCMYARSPYDDVF